MKSDFWNKRVIAAAVVSVLLTMLVQGVTLGNSYSLTDDIAIHHVWLEEGSGRGFVPQDPWIITSKAIQPYVAAVLFQLIRMGLPTLLVGKCLALVLLALTGYLIFQAGTMLRSARTGWFALALFFVSDAWIGISGGFARSFAWPLVCGFVVATLARRTAWAAVCLFFSASLYPVVFVMLLPAYGMICLWDLMPFSAAERNAWWNLRYQWLRHGPVVIAVLAGGILVVLKSRELSLHPLVGPQVPLAIIQQDPVYGVDGRVPFWPQPSLIPLVQWGLLPWDKALLEPVSRYLASMSGVVRGAVSATLAALAFLMPCLALFWVFRSSRRHGWVLLAVALGGVVTFELARLLLPRLYEPARYIVWSVPVLAVLFWATALDVLLGLLRAGRMQTAACMGVLLVTAARLPAIRGKGAEDVSEYKALYLELGRTGGEKLIACFPRTGDFVPLFSHRSVFVSHESSHAVLFSNYKDLVMKRNAALINAFYAADQHTVQAFCREHSIGWLVVEEKYYRQDMPPGIHFAPFEQQIRDMLRKTPQPWLLGHARTVGRQVQPGVYLFNVASILDAEVGGSAAMESSLRH